MHQPNIHEVRENLAEYLDAAARGEEVLICRRNQPVARLVAIARPPREPRPIGGAPDAGAPIPASFWDPLPQDLVDALSGKEPDAAAPKQRPKAKTRRPAR
ncbi:type II toxin-antitoxin system Phd/YefM family antitoxin [Piscinibacter sp.]|uniref:type II toxin-antitoxin system Phd/YefM family antitoxin n=1 Tax=Piscinibacter sp. TaxID=1903157 RepID=UPI002B80FFD7|nr:type II toxin-antitoxin system prevent-host-death family antitoxin [Albitalea sp.]HUG22037.1 type II toxin-antitoxin system prevent-host-death family antitoxin [Albitalea sp.]